MHIWMGIRVRQTKKTTYAHKPYMYRKCFFIKHSDSECGKMETGSLRHKRGTKDGFLSVTTGFTTK